MSSEQHIRIMAECGEGCYYVASPFISYRGVWADLPLIGHIEHNEILWLVVTLPPLISDQIVLYRSLIFTLLANIGMEMMLAN